MNTRIPHPRLVLAPAAALLALLAACGGGGSDSTDSVTDTQAQAMSADTAVLPEDSVEGQATVLATTQAVVAGGTASQTYACAGGGTAVFTVNGGTVASVTNGQLDAGEVYNVTYTNCRGASGAAALTGSATLTVVSASGGVTQVNTATSTLQVALPLRTLTMNGSSTFTQTVVDNGGGSVTTTHHWTSSGITVTSVRSAGTSTYTLGDVDQTRTLTTLNSVITGRTRSGTLTMSAQRPNGSWSITTATAGAVSYDADGLPTQGAWTITLPHNAIGISVAAGTLTMTLDYGNNGSIDRTWTFTKNAISDAAG